MRGRVRAAGAAELMIVEAVDAIRAAGAAELMGVGATGVGPAKEAEQAATVGP